MQGVTNREGERIVKEQDTVPKTSWQFTDNKETESGEP